MNMTIAQTNKKKKKRSTRLKFKVQYACFMVKKMPLKFDN